VSRISALRRRLREARELRGLVVRTARAVKPPPPSAFASFGEAARITPPARIEGAQYVHVGDGAVVGEHAWIAVVAAIEGVTPRLSIGAGTRIDRLVHIGCVGEIEIGAEVVIGERVLVADLYHDYEDVDVPIIEQPPSPPRSVRIERGVLIQPGAAILPGVTIGEGSIVAAGAVVTGDVPPATLAAGNPARVIRRYDEQAGRWEPVDAAGLPARR
jgi:acetyltransferase-like isoleucine patch superfamily enzyme